MAIAVLVALAAAIGGGLAIVGTGGGSGVAPAKPPVEPAGGPPRLTIPDGALRLDAVSREPVADPGARWIPSSGRWLPELLGHCEDNAPPTIAARQVALVDRTLWKAERITVYEDAATAATAIARLRGCRARTSGDGTRTDWTIEPLPGIGEQALFVASLRTRDGRALAGAHRGVVARQGRAIAWFVDYGPGPRRMQTLADVPRYAAYADASARRLASAAWLR